MLLVLVLMLMLLLLLSVVFVMCVGTGVYTGDYDGNAAGVFSKVLRFARSWG